MFFNGWINRRVRHIDDNMTGTVVSLSGSYAELLLRVCWDDNSVDFHTTDQLTGSD